MLDYVTGKDRDEIFATSLLRLVPASGDPRVVPALLKAIKDPSPLIRSAAATALQNVPTEESVLALVDAAGDDARLVRVRAAASLAGYKNLPLTEADKKKVEAANNEYLASILSRPDQWDSHYNLGNYYLDRGDFKQAVASYEKALQMEPRGVLAMVNEAMAYARMGENQKANDALQKALKVAPDNAAANFNMGLLKAEENDLVTSGEAPESSPENRSADGSGGIQPLRNSLEGPARRGGGILQEGCRNEAGCAQVCLYAGLLSATERRPSWGCKHTGWPHYQISGLCRCVCAPGRNL